MPDNLVDWSVLNFRSKLRVATCIYYGQATRVVVLPGGGDEHKMALLHWTKETSTVVEDEERLTSKARETEAGDEYGVSMLNELMSRGSGAVAASQGSYRELADDQRLEVQKILMRGVEAAGIAQALSETVPGNRIRRHLMRCIEACTGLSPSRDVRRKDRRRTSLKTAHISVHSREQPHWLELGVRCDATLRDLDKFLRSLWLECCGHLSQFKINDVTYSVAVPMPGDKWHFEPMYEGRRRGGTWEGA